ncbi:MAG: glycosyltransferase family 4 protein [Hyphomonadaceae bacterium]|nr:glycosyltransferase family 4 protein [Hyphomonadaceae bacterium]MBY0565121.1 glycosyltransferase family 4 protein [Hyphomonadaceae bacterium]
MRVLVLATDAFGGYGGIAQYNRDLIQAMASQAAVDFVDVAVRVAPLSLDDIPKKVQQAQATRGRLHYCFRAAAMAVRARPDLIVNAHLYHGPLALALAKATGARLISQLHGTEIWRDVSASRLGPLRSSDAVLCVSRDTRQRVVEAAPQLAARTHVLPNMVRRRFHPGDRAEARRRFGFGDEKIILTVARLDGRKGYKGHDRVLHTMPDLLRQYDGKVRYVIAGEGDDRARLEGLALSLGVAHAVRFTGRVSDEALPDLYRASDVFAMPSTGEGFGIVYLEAMACGTPAIGLDVGGVRDAMLDGQLGACVPVEQFPEALRAALETSPDADDLSRRVHAHFGENAFQVRVSDMLHSFLKAEGALRSEPLLKGSA